MVVKWEQVLYVAQKHKKLLYVAQKHKNCPREPCTKTMGSPGFIREASRYVPSVGKIGQVFFLPARQAPADAFNGVRVDAWRAGRRGVFPRCGIGYVWTLGLVRRPVALSGLLIQWTSEALDCCCVEKGWVTETFLTMRTLRVDRS